MSSLQNSWPGACVMVELFKDADLAVNLRRHWFDASGTDTLEALRGPAKDVYVQTLIWHIPSNSYISPPLVDAFGLGLGTGPQFFKALYLLPKGQPVEEDVKRHETDLSPLRSNFVVIGNAAITISRCRLSQRGSVPLVLIAGNLAPDDLKTSVLDCVDQELWEAPAFQLPAGEKIEGREPGTIRLI